MGIKKIKEKSTGTAKKSAKTGTTKKSEKPVNIDQVRENITNLVGASADVITREVIEDAKKGALASTKYLFEVAGLYPATEATAAKPEEDWLQNTLIKRLVEPAEPEAMNEEDAEEAPDGAADATVETANPNAAVGKSAVKSEPGESVN